MISGSRSSTAGIYSLSSSSPEEKVAFQELLKGDIDLILNIIDAGNAQRNMYLTTQRPNTIFRCCWRST